MPNNKHTINTIRQFEALISQFESGSLPMNNTILSLLIQIKRRLIAFLWEDKPHPTSINVLGDPNEGDS